MGLIEYGTSNPNHNTTTIAKKNVALNPLTGKLEMDSDHIITNITADIKRLYNRTDEIENQIHILEDTINNLGTPDTPSCDCDLTPLFAQLEDLRTQLNSITSPSTDTPASEADITRLQNEVSGLYTQIEDLAAIVMATLPSKDALDTTIETLQNDIKNKVNINTTSDALYGTDKNGNTVMITVPSDGTVRLYNRKLQFNTTHLTGNREKRITLPNPIIGTEFIQINENNELHKYIYNGQDWIDLGLINGEINESIDLSILHLNLKVNVVNYFGMPYDVNNYYNNPIPQIFYDKKILIKFNSGTVQETNLFQNHIQIKAIAEIDSVEFPKINGFNLSCPYIISGSQLYSLSGLEITYTQEYQKGIFALDDYGFMYNYDELTQLDNDYKINHVNSLVISLGQNLVDDSPYIIKLKNNPVEPIIQIPSINYENYDRELKGVYFYDEGLDPEYDGQYLSRAAYERRETNNFPCQISSYVNSMAPCYYGSKQVNFFMLSAYQLYQLLCNAFIIKQFVSQIHAEDDTINLCSMPICSSNSLDDYSQVGFLYDYSANTITKIPVSEGMYANIIPTYDFPRTWDHMDDGIKDLPDEEGEIEEEIEETYAYGNCPVCGQPLEDFDFCSSCGWELTVEPEESIEDENHCPIHGTPLEEMGRCPDCDQQDEIERCPNCNQPLEDHNFCSCGWERCTDCEVEE